MAQPIEFVPKPVDPKMELQRRLESAPREHAEALLVAYDLLEEAHRQGLLDALHGAIAAKDTILGLLAEYSADPAGVNALRNLAALARLVGTLKPESAAEFSKELPGLVEQYGRRPEPPSLWELYKILREPDARRGLALLASMLTALGRAANVSPAAGTAG